VAPQAACELLGISLPFCYHLMRAGELASFRAGRARRITTASIEAYVARRLADSAATGWRVWEHNPAARRDQRRAAPAGDGGGE
jgi:excisionase family DNA binding protein